MFDKKNPLGLNPDSFLNEAKTSKNSPNQSDLDGARLALKTNQEVFDSLTPLTKEVDKIISKWRDLEIVYRKKYEKAVMNKDSLRLDIAQAELSSTAKVLKIYEDLLETLRKEQNACLASVEKLQGGIKTVEKYIGSTSYFSPEGGGNEN